MPRSLPLLAIAAVFALVTSDALAQQAEAPSAFHWGVSAGFSMSHSSIHDELVDNLGVYDDSAYEDTPDAFGFGGTLWLTGLALHRELDARSQISILAGYRGSVDRYAFGLLDTGFMHRHAATIELSINRLVTVGLGGGIALIHQGGETLNGYSLHFDARINTRRGFAFSLPVDVTIISEARTIALTTVGIQLGWHSFH